MTSEQYYEVLKKRHAEVDWTSRESIHRYNEFARELRKLVREEKGERK